MALNRLGMGITISAKDLATKTLHNVQRGFESLGRSVGHSLRQQEMGMRAVAAGGYLVTVGGLAARGMANMVNVAAQYEAAVASVAAVSGATAAELLQLRDAAIEAGIGTEFSPTEATVGLRELAQQGYSARESIRMLKPTLDLASGSLGQLSPAQAAGLAAQGLKAFGLSVDQAGPSVDKMLQAVNLFALNADELPLALGTASRGAQTLSQSLDETLITLGLVKNVIPSVERSSTAVAVAMERLADPDTQARFRGLGVAVTDGNNQFRDFLSILSDATPKLSKMNEQQRAAWLLQTFGREALGGVNAVLAQLTTGVRDNTGATVKGADAVRYLREQFADAAGTAAMFSAKLLDTLSGQRKLLRGSLETLYIVAGEPLAQALKPLVSWVIAGLNKILVAFKALPEPVKKLAMGAAAAASGITTLIGGVLLLKGAMNLMGFSVVSLLATFAQILIIGPAIALAVGGLGVAAYAAYKAFDKNAGGIAFSWSRMADKFRLAWAGMVATVTGNPVADAVRLDLEKTENQGVVRFIEGFKRLWAGLQAFWAGLQRGFAAGVEALGNSPVMARLLATMRSVFALFTGGEGGDAEARLAAFGAAGERTGARLAQLGEIALTAINRLVEIGGRVAEFVGKLTAEDVASAINGTVDAFRTLGAILGGLQTALSGIVDILKSVWNFLKLVGNFWGELFGGIASKVSGANTWAENFLARRSQMAKAAGLKLIGRGEEAKAIMAPYLQAREREVAYERARKRDVMLAAQLERSGNLEAAARIRAQFATPEGPAAFEGTTAAAKDLMGTVFTASGGLVARRESPRAPAAAAPQVSRSERYLEQIAERMRVMVEQQGRGVRVNVATDEDRNLDALFAPGGA